MAYDDDRVVSEAAHQADHKAAATDADHKTADINHFKRMLTAANKWKIHNGAAEALRSLGVNAQPLGDYF
jgi:hypothetical protein